MLGKLEPIASNAHSLLKRHLVITSLIALCCVAIGTSIAIRSNPVDIRLADDTATSQTISQFETLIEIPTIDLVGRTMVVDWFPQPNMSDLNCSEPTVLDFFVARQLAGDYEGYRPSSLPLFTYNTSELCFGFSPLRRYHSFRTALRISAVRNLRRKGLMDSLHGYQFDRYIAHVTAWTQDRTVNASRAPGALHVIGGNGDFEISLGSKLIVFDESNSSRREFSLIIARTKGVRICSVLLAVAFWISTLMCFLVTVSSARGGKRPSFVQALGPIALIMIMSVLRAGTMPIASLQASSTLDSFAFVPSVFIAVACTLVLLVRMCYDSWVTPRAVTAHGASCSRA